MIKINKIKKQAGFTQAPAFKKSGAGFTLIEVLVVIGIIAILAGIVLIAINPAKQFAQARDTQRYNALNVILNAVGQRMADNKGVFEGDFTIGTPGTLYTCGKLPTASTSILTSMPISSSTISAALGCLVPTYVSTMPVDPASSTAADTGYLIYQDAAGRIHVLSTSQEPSIPRINVMEITR